MRSLAFGVILAILLPAGCSESECTPESHGLGDARRISTRKLPSPAVVNGECKRPRLEVVSTEADLKRIYDELALGTPPAVDFAQERVIYREGNGREGISWTVVDGERAVVGLLGCGTANLAPMCGVEILAAPATFAQIESRTCDPVPCGNPVNPPTTRR